MLSHETCRTCIQLKYELDRVQEELRRAQSELARAHQHIGDYPPRTLVALAKVGIDLQFTPVQEVF